MRISREIRFALVPPDQVSIDKPSNSWAGWPATHLIVPHLVLRCEIEGEIKPTTGFLCNITLVDKHLRDIVTKILIPNLTETMTAEKMLLVVFKELKAAWKHESKIMRLEISVSPYLRYSIECPATTNRNNLQELKVPTQTHSELAALKSARITLTEQFEFSAAHRLHSDQMSNAENLATFGKCNNPEGHGHNYVVEISISNSVELDTTSSEQLGGQQHVMGLMEFESTVKRLVIDRLDHKHLNRDIKYFAKINPTVENISIAIFDWLDGQFPNVKLEKVRLYETPKTWAEYCG